MPDCCQRESRLCPPATPQGNSMVGLLMACVCILYVLLGRPEDPGITSWLSSMRLKAFYEGMTWSTLGAPCDWGSNSDSHTHHPPCRRTTPASPSVLEVKALKLEHIFLQHPFRLNSVLKYN